MIETVNKHFIVSYPVSLKITFIFIIILANNSRSAEEMKIKGKIFTSKSGRKVSMTQFSYA